MSGFFWRRDKDGEERWWLEVTGKGDKTRIIPATHELMVELARYQREKGLTPFPIPDGTRNEMIGTEDLPAEDLEHFGQRFRAH